jgi:peptidoglycan hydrolase-like protein with peptidoglycan-binding domain
VADNAAPTSLATVTRRDLSQQTQVSATLGYGDASVVAVPAGTAPADVEQAQQTAQPARSSLQTAQSALAVDEQALGQARATLAADSGKQAIDCRGANAADASTPGADSPSGSSGAPGGSGGSGGSAGTCAADSQAAAADEQNVSADEAKVQTDRRAVSAAHAALAGAGAAVSEARASEAVYGQASVFTVLPAVGQVVGRGGTLYAIGGKPTVLLYGDVTAWRAFEAGMSPGADVDELNANLRALGYSAPAGSAFTAQTTSAVKAFQAAHGLAPTGTLLVGSVAFEPGAVRVTSVTPTQGAPVQAGPVLDVTSTRRVVTIALDASEQTSVKVGDPVTITLPDNSTTPGHVSFVGTVATTPSSSDQNGNNGAPATPTIEVDVAPDQPAATGRLDQAPVDVSITTATVRDVLAVPVNALLALAGGGYALEVVEAGVHRLAAVTVGLFDDAAGVVQVSGPAVHAGERVVVPAV